MIPTVKEYGPWALVTGASSGIGAAFAEHLAARGFQLLLVARRKDRLESLQAGLQQRHGVTVAIAAIDLSLPNAAEAIMAALGEREVGLVVSNAGVGLKGAFAEADAARLDGMLNVNARTPMLLLHRLLPRLMARPRAGIILTGSMEGELPFPWSTAYAATKAFVHSLGQGLYGELANTGVRLLVLAPGATDTETLALQGFDPKRLPGLLPPAAVAEQALAALGERPLHITGFMNRLLVGLLRLLPRRLRIATTGAAMAASLRQAGIPLPDSSRKKA